MCKQFALDQNMKLQLTAIREIILSEIKKAKKPMSVKLIYPLLKPQPDLSTLYRALDYFETHEIINSISISGTKFYFISNKKGHCHFLSCKECNEIIEFPECGMQKLEKTLTEKYKYTITGHTTYFTGYCPDCKKARDKKTTNKIL